MRKIEKERTTGRKREREKDRQKERGLNKLKTYNNIWKCTKDYLIEITMNTDQKNGRR